MTDETTPDTPADPPSPTSAETPTEPVAAASATPGAGAPAEPRKGVFVPRWLAIVVGLVVAVALVGGGGFALGRATGDDDHHDGDRQARVEDRPDGRPDARPKGRPDRRNLPNLPDMPSTPSTPGGPNGGGSGGSSPSPTGRGAVLGVVVERAGDGSGARIVRVAAGSPAADAGLQADDVITKVDDTDVADAAALAAAIQGHAAGEQVTVTYQRNGASGTARVTLAQASQTSFPDTSPPA